MMFAVWGKPGLNNPDDPASPSGPAGTADPDALTAAADRDGRTLAQTNHDALDAALAAGFADGTLGTSHRGLPVQLIIKADLSDLIREAGLATTATGTLLPIRDLIAMAGDVQPWLAIFKDATTVPLHFGRGRRLATREQRLVSFARPDGEVGSRLNECRNRRACGPDLPHAVFGGGMAANPRRNDVPILRWWLRTSGAGIAALRRSAHPVRDAGRTRPPLPTRASHAAHTPLPG